MDKTVKKGRKAVIECTEDIPCNPCMTCCPKGAITLQDESINSLPVIDEDACDGCGICVASCPGMAIFVVDEDDYLVSFPHEFLPVPCVGEAVKTSDRNGKFVCDGLVTKVISAPKFDCTNVVTVKVAPEHLSKVRGIMREKE